MRPVPVAISSHLAFLVQDTRPYGFAKSTSDCTLFANSI